MPRVITLQAGQSVISTDKSVMDADGVEVCTVTVTALQDVNNADGDPLPFGPGIAASEVVLAVTPSTGVTITQPTGTISETGVVTGSFVSTNATTVTVSATVRGVAVTGTATVVVGGAVVPPTPGDPFFADSFAGPGFNNADGFVWGSANGSVTPVSFDGHNCIRFRYGPNAAGVTDTAEKRFNMGRQLAAVWIEFYLHLPSNYLHRYRGNNKFIRLWGDSYGSLSKVGASTYEVTGMVSGESSPSSRFYTEHVLYTTTGIGLGGSYNPGPDGFGANADPGTMLNRWTRVRMYFKAPTQIGSATQSADSHVTVWFDDSKVVDFNTYKSNLDPDDNYYQNGYLLGWANSGFTDETDLHLRDIKFYDADPGWV